MYISRRCNLQTVYLHLKRTLAFIIECVLKIVFKLACLGNLIYYITVNNYYVIHCIILSSHIEKLNITYETAPKNYSGKSYFEFQQLFYQSLKNSFCYSLLFYYFYFYFEIEKKLGTKKNVHY